MSRQYAYLLAAIVAEVIGTAAFKASEGFTRPLPSAIVIVGYGISFYLFSLVVQTISLGVAYAIWAGLGIVLVVVAGAVVYRQVPDLAALTGILLIIAGVVIISLLSRTVAY
ncbi:MAG: DMT family transporter [Anaerolineae bacterium]